MSITKLKRTCRYINTLFTSVDGNYRQWNRAHKNGNADPALGPGWAYAVAPAALQEHLQNYEFKSEVSTCIPFAGIVH